MGKSSSELERNFEKTTRLRKSARDSPSEFQSLGQRFLIAPTLPATRHPIDSHSKRTPTSSGDDRGRTGNPCLAKAVLSQLSYVPVRKPFLNPPLTTPPRGQSDHPRTDTVGQKTCRGSSGDCEPVRWRWRRGVDGLGCQRWAGQLGGSSQPSHRRVPRLLNIQTNISQTNISQTSVSAVATREARPSRTGSPTAKRTHIIQRNPKNGCTRIRTWDLSLIRAAL